MKVRVLKRFNDLEAEVTREAGEVFEATEARFNEINAKIRGYVAPAEDQAADAATEPSTGVSMENTKAELLAYAAAHGIEVSDKATKAVILAAIDGQ